MSIYIHFKLPDQSEQPDMPRSIEAIEQDLVEMGYYIEDVRAGKCIRALPEQCVSDIVYCDTMTKYQILYEYYRDCLGEFNKFQVDPKHKLNLPQVPVIEGQHIRRFDDAMYSRRMRTDEYFKDKAQTQIDSILSEMQTIMATVESMRSRKVIVDPEAFMQKARQLMFERCEAIFHTAYARVSPNFSDYE
jgi:hypothetical protein